MTTPTRGVPSTNKWSDNSATTSRRGRELDPRKICISDQKITLSAHLNTIIMGDMGEIGWYLKLENNQQGKN